MTVLPEKFAFVSHINKTMKGTVYHAEKDSNWYDITLPGKTFVWHSSILDMREKILSGEFEIVPENDKCVSL